MQYKFHQQGCLFMIGFGEILFHDGIQSVHFVQQQHQKVVTGNLHELIVPFEEVINLQDAVIEKRIGIEK